MDIGLVESVKKLCENKTSTNIFQYFGMRIVFCPFLMYVMQLEKNNFFYFHFRMGKSYSSYEKKKKQQLQQPRTRYNKFAL